MSIKDIDLKNELLERFLAYTAIRTESKEGAGVIPSTDMQWELAKHIKAEMESIGLSDVRLSDNCYVYAKLPSNTAENVPSIGFIAHMDTVSSLSGQCRPKLTKDFDGGDLILNEEKGIVLKVSDFPDLPDFKGKTLINTDGTTVLGADDKAGVAEIMTMASYLLSHPEIKHGDICLGFTPDEETGHGADLFDVEGFGAEFAFTVDGGDVGELEYENFNAAEAHIHINGFGVHPGSAKNKMKNAALIAMELRELLPEAETPQHTEGYEGFYHITSIRGDVESSDVDLIIRDHDKELFGKRKIFVREVVDFLNKKYGEGTAELSLTDQYLNMREMLSSHMDIVELAKDSMKELSIEPKISPIRGGTDGARLSFMGLPCPNLGTGSRYHHGRYETACLEDMELSAKLLITICTKLIKR
ncbi:MAG TPA: peptidase T [Candidatus Avilachnospira avistercoris]|nr:peptidase T [Candidatus Avilachnospira avistercoris]